MEPSRASPAALDGIVVVDLTRAVSGPFCTMMLADLGARVIKIEEPGSGDETRNWGPPFVDGESTYFLGVNRGKESVTLDLKDERDRAVLGRLASRADVLIENFRPGVADRLGAGYRSLSAANPRLVYVSISGFGQSGPHRDRPGYDLIVQALSGFMRVSSTPGGAPVKAGFPVADILAGLFAGQAILAALYRREQTGRGDWIDISLLESMLAAMNAATSWCLLTGEEPAAMGVGQSNIAPYQIFQCQDQPIVIGVPNQRLWRRFSAALERPDWTADERYLDNAARNRNRSSLVAEIEKTLLRQPAAHWLGVLEQHEVPCAPIQQISEILRHPQVAARDVIVAVDHAGLGPIRLVGNPMRFAGFQPAYRPPPRLGEHTAAVREEFAE